MSGPADRYPCCRRVVAAGLLALVVAGLACADGTETGATELSLDVAPVVTVPVGPSRDYFSPGYGAGFDGAWLPAGRWGAGFGADAVALPLRTTSSIRLLAGCAGPVFRYALGRRLMLLATGRLGAYHWAPRSWEAHDANGGGVLVRVGAAASFRIAGPFSAVADVSYGHFAKLAHTARVRIALRLDSKGLQPIRSGLELESIGLRPVFPVLYSHYDDHPVGSVTVRNNGDRQVENIRMRFFVERFMDDPTDVSGSFDLAPGESMRVDLRALFTEEMLGVTEGTEVSARVSAAGESAGEPVTVERSATLRLYDRNAFTWDDDRKLASFVTAKDPHVLAFARNVLTMVQSSANPAVDENLQKALALFEAARAYGVRYEADPTTPFARLSADESAIDFLQFPRQTLGYTSGDCDDLTALYCALLESVGVPTGFVTVPGHIFPAFALASPADRESADGDEVFVRDGRAWVPVEATLLDASFADALDAGVRQWREHERAGTAELYPTHEAWIVFPPVGFGESGVRIGLPDRAHLVAAVEAGVATRVRREVGLRIAALEEELASASRTGTALRIRNRIAVTYARYGLYDEAAEELREIVSGHDYTPALVNLANVHLIRGEHERAGELYDRVLVRDPRNAPALLGLVRCARGDGDTERARAAFERLEAVAPELAARSSHGGEDAEDDTRAARAASDVVVWEEADP